MVTKSEFNDWRNLAITQELLTALVEQANQIATELLRRSTVDTNRDQWLKGTLVGIDLACGFVPELVPENVEESVDGVSIKDLEDAA